MAYDAGTAVLEVVPSFLNIESLLAKGARAMAKGLDDQLGGQLGKAFQKAAGQAERESERAGRKLGQVFAERSIAQVEKALASIPDSDRVLKPLRKELESLAAIDLSKGFDEKDFIRRVEKAYKALRDAQKDAQGPNAVGRYTNAGNAAAALGSVQELVRMARQRGFEAGDAFTNAYQQRLKGMRAALPDIKVDSRSTPDERRAAALRQRVESAQQLNIGDVATRDNNPLNLKIGTKISAADLKRELATIEALLDQFSEQSGQIELILAADKARAQAGAFFDDVKTMSERAAEDEAKAWLKAWDDAHKEQYKRDRSFREQIAKAHDDAIAEDYKRAKKAQDDLNRLYDDAIAENYKRQKRAQALMDKAYDDAIAENYKRQKRAQDDLNKAYDDAIAENYKRQKKAQADFDKMYDDAVAENYKRQKKAAEEIAKAQRDALAEDARRTADSLRGTTAGRAQEGTRTAVGKIQEIPVKLQKEKAEKEIADIRNELDKLGKKTIGINITTNDFAKEAEAQFARLQALAKDKKVRIDIRTDAAKAASELGMVLVELKRIDGKKAEVKVDTDRANAGLLNMLGNLSVNLGRLGALIAIGSSLGTAIVPAAAAAASAIGSIGTAALAAGAGIGVMVLGFSGIGEAVKQMGNLADDQQKSAASLQRAGNMVESAQQQIKSAEMALANTRRNNAQAAIKAQKAITEALRDQKETTLDVKRANEDAVQNYRDARRDATRADLDAKRAQLDLAEAYRQARRAIEDLNSAVRGNALDQRQAALDIAEAKEKLDKILANPRATEAEREQADITYQQRLLQMDDLKRKGLELGEEQEKRFNTGIKGSEEVLKAEQALVDAKDQAAKAQRDLERSELDVTRIRIEGQQKVADAEQKVADARTAAADQKADAAYSEFTATQSLISAQRSLENATTRAGIAGGESLDNLNTAMSKLTPTAQTFAKYLFGMRDAFYALRAAADPMIAGVQRALESLLGKTSKEAVAKMQPLIDFVGRVATALGGIFERFAEALQNPTFQRFFGYIDETAVPTLELLYQVTENLLVGFLNLFLGFTPLTDDVNKGFLGMTESFRKWSEGLSTNKGFQEFIDYLRQTGPEVIDFIGGFIKLISKIVVAAAPMGETVINVFTKIFEWINKIPTDTLALLVSGIAAAAGAIALLGLATSIASLSIAGLVAGAIGLLIVAFGVLVAKNEGVRDFLVQSWELIKKAAVQAWAVIWPVLKQLGQIFIDLWAAAMPTLRQIGDMFVWLWQNVIVPAAQGIWVVILKLWETIQPVFETLMAIIVPVAKIFWMLVKVVVAVVGGIVYALVKILTPVIKFLWKYIISPILTSIGLAFRILGALIKVVVGVITLILKALGALFTWLWEKAIKPAWEKGIKPALQKFANFLEETGIAKRFRDAFAEIGKAFQNLGRLARTPIKFIVETLLNDGLLKGYNWLADKFDVEPKNVRISPPKGGWDALYASGGAVYGPGSGTSDSIRARLSNGEHVLTAREVEAAGGHRVIYALRRAILDGTLFPGFARGGAVVRGRRGEIGDGFGDWLKKMGKAAKDKATDIFTGVGNFLKDPLGSIKKVAETLLAKVPGKDTWFVQKILSIPGKIIDTVKDKVTGLFSGGGQDGGGGAGVFGTTNALGGSGGMIKILRGVFPGLALNSGFRPGSITATGNKSYHSANRAVDVPPRMDVFEWIRANYPNSRELIFSPAGGRQLWNGKPHVYSGVTKSMHYNHVHWAYDKGGLLPDTRNMPGGVMQVFHGRRTPDKVLTDDQWSNMATLANKAKASMRGGDTYNFPYRDSTLDIDELNRWSSRRDALNRVNRENY